MKKWISITAIGSGLTLLSLPTYAYLDPGTGSALIQGLIAAVAAVGVTIKLYWHRIVDFFGMRRETDTQPDSQEREEDQ